MIELAHRCLDNGGTTVSLKILNRVSYMLYKYFKNE